MVRRYSTAFAVIVVSSVNNRRISACTSASTLAVLQNPLVHRYSTAFPVIVLSSMNNHVVDEGRWDYFYKPLWLAAAFINSGYSYYWDVERDWDISFFSNRTGLIFLIGIVSVLYVTAKCQI